MSRRSRSRPGKSSLSATSTTTASPASAQGVMSRARFSGAAKFDAIGFRPRHAIAPVRAARERAPIQTRFAALALQAEFDRDVSLEREAGAAGAALERGHPRI